MILWENNGLYFSSTSPFLSFSYVPGLHFSSFQHFQFCKKKKVSFSSNFSFNWSLWELKWAPKAHTVAFQKSRVHQDHFLTSMSWPRLGWNPRRSTTYLPFSDTFPQGTGLCQRQEIEQKSPWIGSFPEIYHLAEFA